MKRITYRLALWTALVLVAGTFSHAQPDALARAIDRVLADEDLLDSFWGIHVVDVATGETVYGRNEIKNFIPASTMKLLTTAAALDALGPDFRYLTELFIDGDRVGNRLDGNLVIRGTGDPTISDRVFTRHYPTSGDPHSLFRQWADSLRIAGVTFVDGHVIGDDRYFDDDLLGRGWAWDDEPTPFAAQITALSFNEGRLNLTVSGTAPGRRADVRVDPATDYIYVVNRSETVTGGGRNRVRRDQGGNTVWLETEVPAGQTVTHTISVHNPTRYFAHSLRDVFRASGVNVEGDAVIVADWWRGLDYTGMRRVATYQSPPMTELVAVTNKISQNLYAEHLLRTVGAERCDAARRRAAENRQSPVNIRCGSADAGLLAAEPLFERAGMRVDRMRLVDGSGMSHYNMLAPVDLTALLTYMWRHDDERVRAAYVESLAVGGEDGTLRRRFTSGAASGRVFAKTGTVTGARNLAGYITTPSGKTYAFAVMSNLFGTSTGRITRAQDAILETIATH